MPHRTAFVHSKGGTGKTTVCVNTAGFLQRGGERVAIIDTDPEGHATRNLGLEPEKLQEGLPDLLRGDAAANLCVYPTEHGVDVVPGMSRLHRTYDRVDSIGSAVEAAVAAVEPRYDHVLIDVPPQRDLIAAAIRASHDFDLVMDGSLFAQHGVHTLKQFLRGLPDQHRLSTTPRKAVFVETRRDSGLRRLWSRVAGNPESPERIARRLFGTRFVKVPYIDAVVRSQEEGTPLSHLAEVPRGADVFEDLADDLRAYAWGGS